MCISGENPRMDGPLRAALKVFINSFGDVKIWSNLAVVLTKWSFNPTLASRREEIGDTEEKRITELRKWF